MTRSLVKLGTLALILGSLGAVPAVAQMPPDIAAKVKALGPVVDPPHTAQIYAPLQPKPPYAGIKITRDVAYGPAALNKLDVFSPTAAGGDRAVLVFVHGGAFMGGTKHRDGSPFYDNIMVWAARHGMVGVNVNYRLAPKAQWPAAQEDIAAALAWVQSHIKDSGGDPANVFLMGHSAGAVHVASYVAFPEFWKGSDSTLAGAIMVSGEYDLTIEKATKPTVAYYGADTGKYAARSAKAGLLKTKLPLMITHAELDPPMFVRQADMMKKALCAEDRCPTFLSLPKHSHMSEVYSIDTEDTQLSDAIAKFVAAHSD